MFISKRKYKVEKLIAEQRIKHLERIICPKGHEYEHIDCFAADICVRCGKIRKDNK